MDRLLMLLESEALPPELNGVKESATRGKWSCCGKGNRKNYIKKLDKAILGGAEKRISEWEEMFGSELHVVVLGSPKVDLYETDFGWGRPRKIEEIGIDGVTGISLSESRDMSVGIEVGLVLPKPRMDAFTTSIIEGLNAIS
ncbi:anthocyanin 5-aromatic acyltransferase-like [Pyrus ussuriensis x Pyrus communis]|uniref:Anthocyanin 5-aromatic acyltransferase-like n=1 Tax=Pyrus ussuriensis x Pyrus communis TaxID=2448454 RepID=A0A5N5F093_9ROSA|nr:anthocyanin 5-aromatic acyltransferase-like [Pyrus ussuriensis x Pyrus communis]